MTNSWSEESQLVCLKIYFSSLKDSSFGDVCRTGLMMCDEI